jgi:hypothetical protein
MLSFACSCISFFFTDDLALLESDLTLDGVPGTFERIFVRAENDIS